MFIYKTTNLINGKIYVGQYSKNNPNYLGSGKYLKNSIKKYGKENFIREILCECSNKNDLDEKEKYWIKILNCKVPNGYNIADGGEGNHGPHTEETKLKMRKPHGKMSDDGKKNIKLAQNRFEVKEKLRKPKSEETKLKMRKPKSEKHKQKLRKPHGPMSEEHKKKLRKPKSEETKIKIRRRKIGIKRGPNSNEARINMKIAQQKRRESEKLKGVIHDNRIVPELVF